MRESCGKCGLRRPKPLAGTGLMSAALRDQCHECGSRDWVEEPAQDEEFRKVMRASRRYLEAECGPEYRYRNLDGSPREPTAEEMARDVFSRPCCNQERKP